MSTPPVGKRVSCPECGEKAIAIVPGGSKIAKQEENADGKVWVTCRSCGDRFLVHYTIG